mmetsp:Transcript_37773/g.81883  ORF Transcript_37773/g.81883 Transcript_37773/m.81883 type:complete len:86 (+) Transcript_37773:595-852(+)
MYLVRRGHREMHRANRQQRGHDTQHTDFSNTKAESYTEQNTECTFQASMCQEVFSGKFCLSSDGAETTWMERETSADSGLSKAYP